MPPRKPTKLPSSSAGEAAPDERLAPSGFELRLADGRAFVTAAGRPLAQGAVVRRFRMEVPRIRFPFDLSGGADRFRDQRCLLRELEIAVDASALGRWIGDSVDRRGLCEGPLDLAARPGFLELSGRHPVAGPYTAKLAVEIAGAPGQGPLGDEQVGAFLYDFRLYQPSAISAAELVHRFGTQLKPPVHPQKIGSGCQAAVDVLGPVLRQLLVPRGFRLPETQGIGLRRAEVLTGQLVLSFDESDLPSDPPAAAQLLAREGQRAFAEVEALIAEGELLRAREGLRDLSQVEAHPFAAERLLQLLAADPASHDLALDLCGLLRRRSPAPPVALWVEAILREELGGATEWLKAASSFLELAEHSLAERGLFAAAMAARRAASLALRGGDDALATRAYALWESAIPNDVDALLGLAEIAERRGDLPAAMAALRRVSAFAQDGQASASAHGRLGKLLLERTEDLPRARLHLDQALRQNPDDLPSLLALTESCERSGEWVRAVRLKDRAAELARQRGDRTQASELFAQAAATWETRIGRPENALLRYRDALAQEPDPPARRKLLTSVARVSGALGLRDEALTAQREVAQLSPSGRSRAEAFLIEAQLFGEDPDNRAAAEAACLSALEEDPSYGEAADLLVRLRRSGSPLALREALTRAAELSEPARRAELLIERGDLEAAEGAPGTAAARLSYAAALEAIPDHLSALARLATAAEALADHAAAAEAVARLAELAPSPEERAGLLRKLADLASWITDSETAVRLLRPAAAQADAPLPVLLRLLEVERSRVHPPSPQVLEGPRPIENEVELQLALRIAEVAAQAGQPELARSVLVEQLDRVEQPEAVPFVRPLLARAIELDPSSAEVHEVAIRLARLAGDPDGLRAALKASLDMTQGQSAPRRLEIWRELGGLSFAAGLRGDAITAYQAMRGLNADDQGAALALVDLYRLEGRADQQAEALDELSNLLWRTGDRAGAATRLLTLAELVRTDDPARALEILRRAMALNPAPDTLASAAGLAESLGAAPLASEALEGLSNLLEEPRARAEALRRAAELAPDAGRALELGLRCHDADRSYPWGQLLAAIELLRSGGPAELARASPLAEAAYRPAGLSDVERAAAEATAAAAARVLGNLQGEELWLSRLEQRDPEELSYARRRLTLLHALSTGEVGGVDETRNNLTAMAGLLARVGHRLPTDEVADAWVRLGGLRLASDAPGAGAAFREALARDPLHVPALAGLLRMLAQDDPERSGLRRRLLSGLAGRDQEQGVSGPATGVAGIGGAELGGLFAEEARALVGEGPSSREAARAAWTHAQELLPDDPESPRALAQLWHEAGEPRRAAAAQLALAKRLPDDASELAVSLLAAIEHFQSIPAIAEAMAVAEEGLGRSLPKGTASVLWARLADLRAVGGDSSGELAALEHAAVLAPLALRASLQLRRADRFLASGDREAERLALSLALPGREHDLELLQRLRAVSETLGDEEAVADAMELIVKALAQSGDRPAAAETVYALGVLARDRLQKPRRAEAAFRRALELSPGFAEARQGLAELLIARGDAENVGRALELLMSGLAQLPEPARAAASVSLAERAASNLARSDVALKLLRGLKASGALDVRAAVLGAELFYSHGATAEALAWLRDAAERVDQLPPEESADLSEQRRIYRLRRAELLADLGQDQEALVELRGLLDNPPVPAAAIDQLIMLLDRGVEEPRDAPDFVFRIAREVRSPSRAVALISAEAFRRLRRGEPPALVADRLRAASELASGPDRRRLFQVALARLGNPAAIEALVESLRGVSSQYEVAPLLAQTGQELRAGGEFAAAATVLAQAAHQFITTGNPRAAVSPLREALEIERTPARVLALANVLNQLGELGEASALDAELCESGTRPPLEALERRAQSLRQGGDLRALGSFLERHSADVTAGAAWLLEASRLHRTLGDSEAEQRDLRAAFAIEPQSAPAFSALLARGDLVAAGGLARLLVLRANAVRSEAPAEALALWRLAAELLLQEGRLTEAADVLDAALAPESGADPLMLAARLEVAAAQHQPLDAWLQSLDRALAEGLGDGCVVGEAIPRAAAALLAAGLPEKAQHLLDLGRSLPAALSEGHAVLELRDQVALARGDRVARLAVRQALLRRATGMDRAPALEALLDILTAQDPDAPLVLREAWEAQSPPRSVELAQRLGVALEGTKQLDALAALLEEIASASLVPEPTEEQRIAWALQGAEILHRQGHREKATALFERALRASEGSPPRLRDLLASQLSAEVRAKVLWGLAELASPEERALLLLERARLTEESLAPDLASVAWTDVLREGPGGPGYLLALERTLARALAEGRYAEAADALAAQAEVIEGGQARAQLLERAAQIRETQLSDVSGALELYRRAAAESGDVKWFATLAEAYDRAGRTAEAAAALGVEVARREPGERRREQQRKLGLMLARELNRPSDALPHLRAVALVDAQEGLDDAVLLEALADCGRAAGDAESELMALSRLPRSTDRSQIQWSLLRRAELLHGLDRSAEAADLWNGLLEVDPGNRQAFEALAAQLRVRKAWRELAELLERHAAAVHDSLARRAELLVERGAILEGQLADPALAEQAYREALACDPTEARALAALRRLVDARGDQGELAELLAGQIASSSVVEGAPLALHLGELQLRLGTPEKAVENLRRALVGAERAPMLQSRVRLPLAQAELQLGNGLEALAQAEAALTAGSPDSLALLALAGQAALQIGERLRSLGHFRELLNRHPGDPAALSGLVALSRDHSDEIAAEALSQRIAHHDDPDGKAKALRELALLREARSDPASAEAALRESVRLDPDDEEGFTRLRQLLEADGRFQELSEALRERARGTTDEVVRASSLAEQGDLLRTHLHNPAGAAEAYQRSLEILPRASTSEGYAEALVTLGSDELAAEHYRRALAGGGHLGEFFLLYRLAEIARRLGDHQGALEQYRRAVEANPSFLPAREAMVELAEELGASEIAREALRSMAQQLDPREFPEQVAGIELRISEIEKRALHFEAAAESLKRAAKLQPRDPRPLERLAALYQNTSRWAEAVPVLEQLADLRPGPPSAVPLTAAGEISFEKLGNLEQAFEFFTRALAASPGQEVAIRRSLEIAATLGKRHRLVELADSVLPHYVSPTGTKLKATPAWLDQLMLPLAHAYEQLGRLEEAQRLLSLARERAPLDLDLLQRQSSIAKQSGRFGDEAELEEQLIARLAEQRPLEAATRLRVLARRWLEKTDDQQQPRRLLEQAAELAPARAEDRRLLADLWRQTDDPGLRDRALETYLELVRRDPVLDLVLLRMVAAVADECDRPELAQIAEGLLQALEATTAGPAPTPTPLPQAAWSAGSLAAEPGLDFILQALASYLEPLFPVQLSRYGITEADRVSPEKTPELQPWVERVKESLGSRPLEVYLAKAFRGVAIEPTRPTTLVIGADAVRVLGQAGLQWLLAQRVALNELGFSLSAKFSAADLTTLATLATLFLSEAAPVAPADQERLQAFLEALRRTCPEQVRQGLAAHAPKAVRELPSFNPYRFAAAASGKASRLALLVTGDLRAALAALRYLELPQGDASRSWELPSVKDLIAWAFSDEYLALRRSALGKPPR